MSAVDLALPRVKVSEGYRAHVYLDTRNLETIGYGFRLAAGISERAAAALLREQMAERHDELMRLPWYSGLDEVRQGVCLDIAINSGTTGLLRFSRMIDALEAHNWVTAAAECKVINPELAGRYRALAQLLLTGAQ
jgi:GH24 family phage-related lysozyme (muramidase)